MQVGNKKYISFLFYTYPTLFTFCKIKLLSKFIVVNMYVTTFKHIIWSGKTKVKNLDITMETVLKCVKWFLPVTRDRYLSIYISLLFSYRLSFMAHHALFIDCALLSSYFPFFILTSISSHNTSYSKSISTLNRLWKVFYDRLSRVWLGLLVILLLKKLELTELLLVVENSWKRFWDYCLVLNTNPSHQSLSTYMWYPYCNYSWPCCELF